MLEAKTIDLHYGAAQALRSVSLTAEPGKVTCVLGRNGVGKTSLLDALAGQQPVSRGSISQLICPVPIAALVRATSGRVRGVSVRWAVN